LLIALALVMLVSLAARTEAAEPFRVDKVQGEYFHFSEGSQLALRYVFGEVLIEGVPIDYARSTYIHPIYSIDGKVLTDDFPKDHYHHRGLSWMWTKVSFDGVTKDLWGLKGVRQKCKEEWEPKAYDDRAVLTINDGWYEDSTGRKIIDEVVTVTVYRADEEGRIFDWELNLAAVDTPVSIDTSDRGYGGFNLRFAPRKDTTIITSKGPVTGDQDRQRYAWADLSGRFEGSDEFDGIAIFDNKSNPHYPTGWTLRNYGILNPAFTSSASAYTIEVDKPLTLKYRVYVHKGKGDPDRLDRMFWEYNGK